MSPREVICWYPAYVGAFPAHTEPKTFQEAAQDSMRIDDIKQDIDALENNKT